MRRKFSTANPSARAKSVQTPSEIQENRQIFALFHTQKLSFLRFLNEFSSSVPRGEKSSNIYSLIFIFSPALKITQNLLLASAIQLRFLPLLPLRLFQRDVTPILLLVVLFGSRTLCTVRFFPSLTHGQVSRFSSFPFSFFWICLQFGTMSDFLDQLARLSNFECRLGCAAQLGKV